MIMANLLHEASNQEFVQNRILHRLGQSQLKPEVADTSMPVSFRQGLRVSSAGQIDNGVTPLMQACHHGKGPAVDLLIRKDPNSVRDRDRTGKTAVHYCSENLSLSCIEQVLRLDPSLIATKDEDGYTPLHLATIAGNQTVVKFLLSKGADIHARDNENHTVCHWATVCGELELLDLLIEAGANANSPDIHGAYPIHYAAQMCGPNSELGNDVTLGLMVLQKLLQHGADVTVTDHDGRQPLLWAASAGSSDAILSLVNAGADVTSNDKDGLTASHCAASRGHLDCLEVLINFCNAEVDILDSNGCTPLFYSVTLGHADCTEYLLRHGAIPDRQDRKGRTPAHCGAAKGQLETLKLLHRRKADLWRKNVKGDLPLHEACQSGRTDLIIWLLSLEKGAVNAANHDGRCPLHIAALSNNVQLCKILMDHKALVNPIMRNSRGQLLTPVDAALAKGHKNCAQYLQLHGGLPASKLTDKKALQLAMQRALEHSPTGHTGATPSDLDEGIHTPSTTSKTPQSPVRFTPSVASQTNSYSDNRQLEHSEKQLMEADSIRDLALQEEQTSTAESGNVLDVIKELPSNGVIVNETKIADEKVKNIIQSNTESVSGPDEVVVGDKNDGQTKFTENEDDSKTHENGNQKENDSVDEQTNVDDTTNKVKRNVTKNPSEEVRVKDNIAPEREPCDGASEDGDSVRLCLKADGTNTNPGKDGNDTIQNENVIFDTANEEEAGCTSTNDQNQQPTATKNRKLRPQTANVSKKKTVDTSIIKDERTHEMILISNERNIGLVQDAPEIDSNIIKDKLDPNVVEKCHDLNKDSTDEGNNSGSDLNQEEKIRKSHRLKRKNVKAVMSSSRPHNLRGRFAQGNTGNDIRVNREGTAVLSRKLNGTVSQNGEADSESDLESDGTKTKVNRKDANKLATKSKNYKQDPLKRVMSGGPRKVENLERSLKKKSPQTEVSITQAMQTTMRKYSLEKRLFEQLLHLKRIQIRHSKVNESVLIKRMVDEYNKEINNLGVRSYGGPFKFENYEKYLYDQLRHLQSTQLNKIPNFKPSDDIAKLNRLLSQAKIRELPEDLDSVRDAQSCNHSTHRCHHVIHAYTGVPCAAYLSKAYRQRNKGTKFNLPKITTNYKPKDDSSTTSHDSRVLEPNNPVTVEFIDGNNKQQVTLPTELLDKSKKYQLTLSIQPSTTGRLSDSTYSDGNNSISINSARSAPDPALASTTSFPPTDMLSAPPTAGGYVTNSRSLPNIGHKYDTINKSHPLTVSKIMTTSDSDNYRSDSKGAKRNGINLNTKSLSVSDTEAKSRVQAHTDVNKTGKSINPSGVSSNRHNKLNEANGTSNKKRNIVSNQKPNYQSNSNDKQPISNDKQPNSNEKQPNSNEKQPNSNEKKTNSNEKQPNSYEKQPNLIDRQLNSNKKQLNSNEKQQNSNENPPNSNEKQHNSNEKQQNSNEKQQNSNEKQQNSNEKQQNSNEKQQNPNAKQHNSNEKPPNSYEKPSNSNEKQSNSNEKQPNSNEKLLKQPNLNEKKSKQPN